MGLRRRRIAPFWASRFASLLDDPADAGTGGPVSLCDIGQAHAAATVAENGLAVDVERGAADAASFQFGAAHAGPYALDNKVAFQLGDGQPGRVPDAMTAVEGQSDLVGERRPLGRQFFLHQVSLWSRSTVPGSVGSRVFGFLWRTRQRGYDHRTGFGFRYSGPAGRCVGQDESWLSRSGLYCCG
jgi:hypothetical protein